ncbi:hypothetical protein RMATCC62417_14308 [Rhizopus microsporus]|nr:hypothetical protein RMATCC62417_14308 [Rhizopus microsporus]
MLTKKNKQVSQEIKGALMCVNPKCVAVKSKKSTNSRDALSSLAIGLSGLTQCLIGSPLPPFAQSQISQFNTDTFNKLSWSFVPARGHLTSTVCSSDSRNNYVTYIYSCTFRLFGKVKIETEKKHAFVILLYTHLGSWCEAMPKTTTRKNPTSRRVYSLKDIKNTLARFLCDPKYFWHLAGLVLVGEFVLSTLIVQKVSYTEIDWKAYMQEVEGFLNGERDYTKLRGDTGPLVYPAGFVYIYSLLYYLTNRGTNVRTAQYMFEALYLINQSIVMGIYSRSKKVPPYVILLLACSKRFHSIFLLRCFNDPVAMSFMYACILAMTYRRWTLGTVLFSCALSIKMNVLLFFPAFGILLWLTLGAWKTVGQLGLLAMTQGLLAYPFLASYPKSYFSKAFEFGRAFDYTWTVNWRMVSKETFLSDWFSKLLLAGHGGVLLAFIIHIWLKPRFTKRIEKRICRWKRRYLK